MQFVVNYYLHIVVLNFHAYMSRCNQCKRHINVLNHFNIDKSEERFYSETVRKEKKKWQKKNKNTKVRLSSKLNEPNNNK